MIHPTIHSTFEYPNARRCYLVECRCHRPIRVIEPSWDAALSLARRHFHVTHETGR